MFRLHTHIFIILEPKVLQLVYSNRCPASVDDTEKYKSVKRMGTVPTGNQLTAFERRGLAVEIFA
jgi:hypothetical protein